MNKSELKIRLLAGAALALVIGIGARWVTLDQIPVTNVSNGLPLVITPEVATQQERNAAPRGGQSETINGVPVQKSGPVVNTQVSDQIRTPDPVQENRSGCFLAKFEHHRTRGHTTREECSRHQNEIVLSQDNGVLRAIQEKTPICVKLNGTPLEFEKKGNRISFANVAGPDSVVTIQYCLGKSKCTDPCGPKKDAFLSAVGADEDDTSAGSGQWDTADRDDGDLGTEFSDLLEAEKRQPRGATASSTDWSTDPVTSGCGQTSVSSR